MHFSVLWVFLLGLGVLMTAGCSQTPKGPPQMPPPNISFVEVDKKQVPLVKEFVGQLYGYRDVPIRTRVEGYVQSLHFQEGSNVKKGQLLYTIDPQPFQAEVAAKESQLAQSKINSIRAASDLERYEPLVKVNAVSQSDYDAAKAEDGASRAAVRAAEADLKLAKINLSYTKIYSPINGLIGRTDAKIGEFVGRDPNPVILNQVSRIDTMLAEFFITETDYLSVARAYHESYGDSLHLNPADERTPFTLVLSDGSIFDHKGKFNFIDREVDPATGSLLIQASFPNPERILRPGQFARVRASIENDRGVMVIPQRSVSDLQGRHLVYVLQPDSTVKETEISLGSATGDMFIVSEGLNVGDQIVVEGLQKVRDGAKVVPNTIEFISKQPEGVPTETP
ncbi:efflux RND transporter periplasmic adaptor subunit [Pontibacter sp. G13]|uniref:efflux RND transporter periplasmic adaptor subunit n=1 Tax=Pontibacter sp. G13 TaxID=3074898 RepID=UPI00288988AA|nr:efflux RND transporter periplasmic adaptor subunit [Pontibacter sp. G13]WNJ20289.1 efflux RND transporter periplasmic adaptor subunit [Pontibacter sp. G13]